MNDDRIAVVWTGCCASQRYCRGCRLLTMPHGTALGRAPGGQCRDVEDGVEECVTGNLQVDLFGMKELRSGPALQDVMNTQPMPTRKSIWIAAGLSALIPGAGEIYAESYWKAALFIAIEAAAWTVAYTQDRKGDQQTDNQVLRTGTGAW
jgi:hypothetical protein